MCLHSDALDLIQAVHCRLSKGDNEQDDTNWRRWFPVGELNLVHLTGWKGRYINEYSRL